MSGFVGSSIDQRAAEDMLATSVNMAVDQVNSRAVGNAERVFQHRLVEVEMVGDALNAKLLVNNAALTLNLR